MNTENIELLQNNLKYLGFSQIQGLNEQLLLQLAKEPDAFQVTAEAAFEEDYRLEAILFFRRSTELDMYFLIKYIAKLFSDKNPGFDRMHTFYISRGSGITVREAFNLLQGRSVNKDLATMEGQKYNAWIQLDFSERDEFNSYQVKKFRQQYGYNLEKVLERYPIRELKNDEQKANLIKQLRKGNQYLVTFEKRTKNEKMFIEANPLYKTINIYPVKSKQSLDQSDHDE